MVNPRVANKRNKRAYLQATQGDCCAHCGAAAPSDLDHIIPLAAGGASTRANLQLLCRACNHRKGSGPDRRRRGEIKHDAAARDKFYTWAKACGLSRDFIYAVLEASRG